MVPASVWVPLAVILVMATTFFLYVWFTTGPYAKGPRKELEK